MVSWFIPAMIPHTEPTTYANMPAPTSMHRMAHRRSSGVTGTMSPYPAGRGHTHTHTVRINTHTHIHREGGRTIPVDVMVMIDQYIAVT